MFQLTRAWARVVLIGSGLVLLAGCASLQRPDVERVAAEFAGGDPAARCALLAPATVAAVERTASATCAQVVAGLAPSDAQVLGAAVWGDAAQVRTGADTLFLTRTSAGWKVAAAGCAPQGDAPYECEVDGP